MATIDPVILHRHFPHLEMPLIQEMAAEGTWAQVPQNTEILKEGTYIQVVPLVLKGVVKVYQTHADKELLLYYIRANESCIMSFSAVLHPQTSRIYAVTEEDSELLLLPILHVERWMKQYASFNRMFYALYQHRYEALLGTIQHLLFDSLDQRLLDYLRQKSEVRQAKILKLKHWQIAQELGTAREVVSRLLKKLEYEQKIKLHPEGIELV